MYKSQLSTFGLLASSLVMLSVMPILNNNSILNVAMAQGYDADYGDSSSYSKYPTDDKKYECRTGPFEGFFVGSVEFCKHVKFDNDRKDNRDNRTGTQGPPGPAGPPGATGPAGPPGATGPAGLSTINTTDVYTKVGPSSIVLAGSTNSSIAFCDIGDTALSGSFVTNGSAIIRSDKPLATENGWNAIAQESSGIVAPQSFVTADVVCFDNPPAHIP